MCGLGMGYSGIIKSGTGDLTSQLSQQSLMMLPVSISPLKTYKSQLPLNTITYYSTDAASCIYIVADLQITTSFRSES